VLHSNLPESSRAARTRDDIEGFLVGIECGTAGRAGRSGGLVAGVGFFGGVGRIDGGRLVLFDLGGLFAGGVDVFFDAGQALLEFDDAFADALADFGEAFAEDEDAQEAQDDGFPHAEALEDEAEGRLGLIEQHKRGSEGLPGIRRVIFGGIFRGPGAGGNAPEKYVPALNKTVYVLV